jgi:RNA polymerase sigma factor (sigma-70 family)
MYELNEGDVLRLIGEVLRGDRDAFEPIVKKYNPLIARLAHAFLRDKEDVLDACQEIFLRIFKGLSSFKLDKRFEPWLYSVALNYLRAFYTTRKKKVEDQKSACYELAREAERATNHDENDLVNSKEIVQKAVQCLADELREVVILYYMEDKNVSEIGEILGLGSENIKSKLFRARKKLREIIERDAT